MSGNAFRKHSRKGDSRTERLGFRLTANSQIEDGYKLSLFDLKEGVELFAATLLRADDQSGLDENRLVLIMKVTGGRGVPVPGGGALEANAADVVLLISTN